MYFMLITRKMQISLKRFFRTKPISESDCWTLMTSLILSIIVNNRTAYVNAQAYA